MSIKARTVTLTTTPVLLESPEKSMTIYFSAASADVRIGGSDLTSSTNGFNPGQIGTPDYIILERDDDLYAVLTAGTSALSYLAIGD